METQQRSTFVENLWLFAIALVTLFLVYVQACFGWLIAALFLGVILSPFALWIAFVVNPAEEREAADRKAIQNRQMICPHCQQRGAVRTEKISLKKGIDGGKATAALLTGGVTMLATGLSRKEEATKATCSHCGSVWMF